MLTLARKAMEDGAFGLSTGLFYVPGSYSEIDRQGRVLGNFTGNVGQLIVTPTGR
jgi:N-acyl-D-amino-acid deacylase